MTYDDNSMLDLLTNTSNVNSFAKAVGDFTSELARPIIDHKKSMLWKQLLLSGVDKMLK